jgi:hypothetical protein
VSSLGWDIQGSLPRRGGVGVETWKISTSLDIKRSQGFLGNGNKMSSSMSSL